MSFSIKHLDYLFIARPVLMPPVWTILLLGHHRSSLSSASKNSVGIVFLLISASIGAVYILNQIHDIDSDRINKKLFFLADGYISLKRAWLETVLLTSIGIIGALIISFPLGILFILGFLFGYLYSAPPSSLKNRHIWGLLSNALGHGSLTFLIGWSINSTLTLKALLFSAPYFLAVGAVYLNTTLPDIEGDGKVGKITLGAKLGIPLATGLSVIFVLSSLFLAWILKDLVFVLAGALSFPFFLYAALTKRMKQIILSSKMAVLFLTIAAAIFYPWYFILLTFGFLFTRVYYRSRFNMAYPTLS
jgi:4-hydroxybenzoate polyprenyltransferase